MRTVELVKNMSHEAFWYANSLVLYDGLDARFIILEICTNDDWFVIVRIFDGVFNEINQNFFDCRVIDGDSWQIVGSF